MIRSDALGSTIRVRVRRSTRDRCPRHASSKRRALSNTRFQCVAIAAQIDAQPIQPVRRIFVCGERGGVSEHADAGNQAAPCVPETAAQRRVRNHRERATQTGRVVRFRRRHQRDGPGRDLVRQRCNGDVRPVVQPQITVDFVGADQQIVPFAELCEFDQLARS